MIEVRTSRVAEKAFHQAHIERAKAMHNFWNWMRGRR